MLKPQPIGYRESLKLNGEDTGFVEAAKTAFLRDVTPLTMAAIEKLRFGDAEYDPSFVFADAISQDPFLDHNARHLAHAKNREHFDFVANSLRENQMRRDKLENTTFWTSMGAEIANPINLLFAFPALGVAAKAATGTARIAQSARTGLVQGLAAGVATEAIRYPFDQLETGEEALMNIGASAAFGGVLGAAVPAAAQLAVKAVPALRSRYSAEFNLAEARLAEFEEKGIDFAEYRSVNADDAAAPRVSIERDVVNEQTGEVFDVAKFNESKIADEFESKSFASPDVSGGTGLPTNAFETFEMYKNFLFNKEKLTPYVRQELGETDVEFESRINTYALSDTARGYGLTKNWFTSYHPIGSPAFNILRDPKVPEGIKRLIALQTGNNQISLKRNEAGYGTNAVDQQMGQFDAKFRAFSEDIENLWVEAVKGRKSLNTGIARMTNTNLEDLWFVPNNKLEWIEQQIDVYLDTQAGIVSKKDLNPIQLEMQGRIKEFFRDFLNMSQDEGMLLGIKNYDFEIERLTAHRNELIARVATIKTDTKKGLAESKAMHEEIDRLMDGPDGIRELQEARRSARKSEDYNIPRFYNVVRLRNGQRDIKAGRTTTDDALFFQRFFDVLRDEYSKTPVLVKSDKDGKLVDHVSDPDKDALDTIAGIIEDGHESVGFIRKPGKGKHLKRRALNMPDSVIKEFLVKDLSVFGKYAESQGFNIAWRKNYGDKTLDDVLRDIELIGEREGTDPKLIKKAKQALYGDYLRTTNAQSGSPHRWDNQIYKVLSSFSAYTRLPASGMTAFGDLANLVAARPFVGMVRDLTTDLDALSKVVKDIDSFVEVLSLHPNLIKEQLMADAKSGVQPTFAERLTHYPDRLWFNTPILGNDLLPITSATRHLAAAYNASDITKLILKIGDYNSGVKKKKPTAAELRQAGSLGLNPRVVDSIYTQLKEHHQVSDSGRIFFANSRAWDTEVEAGRDALSAFSQAIDIATDAQIIMAKNFDKPRIVDGLMFVPYHPIMKVFNMEVDPRASYNGIQYAKVSSGFLKFPFQFMNYTFGATNSVLGRSFDPTHERQLQHLAASFASGMALLYFTKGYLFTGDTSAEDIALRAVDRAGMAGIYGDLIYEGLHTAQSMGADPDALPFQGKFRARSGYAYGTFTGPAPMQVYDLAQASKDYINNQSTKHAKALSRNLPYLHIAGWNVNAMLLHDITKD